MTNNQLMLVTDTIELCNRLLIALDIDEKENTRNIYDVI